MRFHWISLVAVAAILGLGIAPQVATAQDNTFNNNFGNDWEEDRNWSLTHEPTGSENAIIPSGETCYITTSGRVAASFEVGGGSGLLHLNTGTSLKITADSVVEGLVTLEGTAALIIDGNLTVDSVTAAGVIRMENQGSEIKDNGGNEVLTITDTDIRGVGTISIGLVNDGAVIADVANLCDVSLNLTSNAKYGNGIWGAEAGGCLSVDVAVYGAADWKIVSTDSELDSGSAIHIDVQLTSELCGDVVLEDGTFYANQNFCTGGHLIWKSVVGSEGNTSPRISVASAKAASFKSGSCGCSS